MKSASVEVFFSCSFDKKDIDVNKYFEAICKAINIRGVNVNTAFSETPPNEAKSLIDDAQGLIAIATKRTKLTKNKYRMPSAVHDELSIAFGMDTPVLMFVEEGVVIDGFVHNYGTSLRFNRDQLYNIDFLEKAIAALHGFKMKILSAHELILNQCPTDFYVEYQHQLLEMREVGCNDYTWEYSISKKIIFEKQFKWQIKCGIWVTVTSFIPQDVGLLDWNVVIDKASKPFEVIVVKDKHTVDCFDGSIRFNPHPDPGDFIEYSITCNSKYLNPIWDDEIEEANPLRIDDNVYNCYDGTVPNARVKKAILEYRFPRSYGLEKKDIVPYVGIFTSKVDYLVECELKRSNVKVNSVAGNINIKFDIDSPLLQHEYGVAWNPKTRPKNKM